MLPSHWIVRFRRGGIPSIPALVASLAPGSLERPQQASPSRTLWLQPGLHPALPAVCRGSAGHCCNFPKPACEQRLLPPLGFPGHHTPQITSAQRIQKELPPVLPDSVAQPPLLWLPLPEIVKETEEGTAPKKHRSRLTTDSTAQLLRLPLLCACCS